MTIMIMATIIDHHHRHRHHNHLQNIMTVCIVEPGELDGMKLSVLVPLADRRIRRQPSAHEGHPQPARRPGSVPVPRRAHGIRRTARPGLERRRGPAQQARLHRPQARPRGISRGFKSCLHRRGDARDADPFGRLLESRPIRSIKSDTGCGRISALPRRFRSSSRKFLASSLAVRRSKQRSWRFSITSRLAISRFNGRSTRSLSTMSMI